MRTIVKLDGSVLVDFQGEIEEDVLVRTLVSLGYTSIEGAKLTDEYEDEDGNYVYEYSTQNKKLG